VISGANYDVQLIIATFASTAKALISGPTDLFAEANKVGAVTPLAAAEPLVLSKGTRSS
jgi:hypothetical protein